MNPDPFRQPHEGEELLGGNEKERAMRALYKACYEVWPEQWLRKADIYDLVLEQQATNDWLDWFGDPRSPNAKEKRFATRRIGDALSAFKGRIFNDVRLIIDTSNQKSQQWQYKFTKNL